MDRKQRCLSLAMVLTLSSPLFAETALTPTEETPWYQVDVIIFLNKSSLSTTQEAWPEPRLRPIPSEAIPLTSVGASTPGPDSSNTEPMGKATDAFIALPSSAFLLKNEASQLSQSSSYQVLRQMAWRMPVSPDQKDHPVQIKTPIDNDAKYMLSGVIDVSAQRYLHVDVDLWYNALTPNTSPPDPISEPQLLVPVNERSQPITTSPLHISKSFQLDESRRITNTQQIQYLDTPVLGVLLKLTPHDSPTKEKEPIPQAI